MTIGSRQHKLLLLLAMLALLAAFCWPRSAAAHASLLSATPAEGVVIAEPPKNFQLEFNEPVSPLAMRLVRPDGQIAPLTDVRAENNSVVIAVPAMPLQGSYALSWRVISADGHPVGGVVSFALGHASAGLSIPASPGAAAVHAALWAAQFLLAVGLFFGAGGGVFVAWLRRKREPLGTRLGAAAIVGGIGGALLSLSFQGLDVLAEPLSQTWRPAVWAAGFATSWGTTVVVALAALAAGLVALRAARPVIAKLAAAVAVTGIGVAFAASGHASTSYPLATVPVVFLHVTCVALWIGALVPLAFAVRAGDRIALERFSGLIPLPLALLIVTGVALTIVNFDRPDALWTTDYGLVLAAKLSLVLVLLALAAINRYALVPRLAVTGERGLVTAIAAEIVLAILILGVVGLWRFTPPPRAIAAAETTYIHFHGERLMAQIDLTPERGRGASITIDVTDVAENPIAAKEVALVIWNPTAGISPIELKASFEGGSRWRVNGVHIPVGGVWRMRAEILVGDFDKLMLEDNVELPHVP